MPTPIAPPISLTQNARVDLQALARANSTPKSLALRACIVLRAVQLDRPTNPKIGHELGVPTSPWENGDGVIWSGA